MKSYFLYLVLTLCFLSASAYAEPFSFRYMDVYGQGDGLADGSVTKILTADDGTMWFGTWSGEVSSYDGTQWRTYEHEPWGHSEDWVLDMSFDSEGRPWIGTPWGPIYYFDDQMFVRFGGAYPIDVCTALAFSETGILWAGGLDWWAVELIGRYQEGIGWLEFYDWPDFVDYDHPDGLTLAKDGSAWFVTAECVHHAIPGRQDLETYVTGGKTQEDLAIIGDQDMWIVAASPPILHSPGGESWSAVGHPAVSWKTDSGVCVTAVEDQGLWFGMTGGAFWYDFAHWRFFDVGQCADIAVDRGSGDVWFATWPGVAVLRGGPDAWPAVWAEIRGIQDPASPESRAFIMGDAEFQMDLTLDLYVAVQLPDGMILYAPDWTPSMTPSASGVDVPIGLTLEGYPLLELDLTGIPSGTYRWYAAFMYAGTMDFASNIASCEWHCE